jgi:predicted nucleic acid-binding protein
VDASAFLEYLLHTNRLSQDRAVEALRDYLDLPVTPHGHVPLLLRIFALRDNFSAYDAAYVALAEGFGATLLSGDAALARAAKAHAHIETLPA